VPEHFVVAIDPILISLGPLAIRWYGLAYFVGFIIGLKIFESVMRHEAKLPAGVEPGDFLTWAVLGVIAGGRLGEVIFYRADHYLAHPLEILMVWKGGMASHGGMIGLALAAVLWARRNGVAPARLFDAIVLAAPPGLFLGRIANFINQEMVGKVADVPWAVIFPVHDWMPRHPVQIYQALTEGPLLFALVWLFPARRFPAGARTAVAMIVYGLLRTWTEIYRQTDPGYLGDVGGLTNGQVLSLLLAAAGAALLAWRLRAARASA